jgi:uncharacterized protein with PIN domain
VVVIDTSAPLAILFDELEQPGFNERIEADATIEQAEIAREAYRRYGRGNHPAGLNFGDCFAYALAKSAQQSLLFKGHDFARTNILAA